MSAGKKGKTSGQASSKPDAKKAKNGGSGKAGKGERGGKVEGRKKPTTGLATGSGGKSKSKTGGETVRKEAQLLVRVDKTLRDEFVEACRSRDTSASRELRRFMREYLAASHP